MTHSPPERYSSRKAVNTGLVATQGWLSQMPGVAASTYKLVHSVISPARNQQRHLKKLLAHSHSAGLHAVTLYQHVFVRRAGSEQQQLCSGSDATSWAVCMASSTHPHSWGSDRG